jgi:predicted nucleic acid-binding protein
VLILDTNVFVYALGGEHPLRKPCRELLDRVGSRSLVATTTAAVLQEFAHVVARRRPRAAAVEAASDLAHALGPTLPMTSAHVGPALRIFRAYPALSSFDAFLVAAALDADADALVSADRHLRAVTELHVLDPRDL